MNYLCSFMPVAESQKILLSVTFRSVFASVNSDVGKIYTGCVLSIMC